MSARAALRAAAAADHARIPVLDCVPTCVGPDNPPRYEPVTYGAFTERLLTLNFAHRQTGGSTGE